MADIDNRESSLAKHSAYLTNFAHEEFTVISNNPLEGRYGSNLSNNQYTSIAKGSQFKDENLVNNQEQKDKDS